MDALRAASIWILLACWILFSSLLAHNHRRVRRERRRRGIPEERPALRDPRSMHGLALEGLSFLIAFAFLERPLTSAAWRHAGAIVFAILAVAILFAALRHLGLEWRIKAVVTGDHRLVTTGPYAHVRHPVFTALFCLLIATALLLSRPWAGALAVVICLYGTHIRIRAEDSLLRHHFGPRFEQYRARVPSLAPFLPWY